MPGGDPHSSFSVRKEIDSLHSLDQLLSRQHPTWTPEQVRAERHFRWKNGMGQAQVETFHAEKRRDETMQSKEAFWDVVDGDLVHPNYGSFQNMIDASSSEEERASLVAWREAVINAEPGSQIVSLDYHNGLEIRYADAWIKDANGRVSQQVRADIAVSADLNGVQALQFLSRLGDGKKNVVVDKDHTVGLVVIQPSASAVSNVVTELLSVKKTFADAGKATMSEINTTVRSVQHDMEEKKLKRADGRVTVQKDDAADHRITNFFGLRLVGKLDEKHRSVPDSDNKGKAVMMAHVKRVEKVYTVTPLKKEHRQFLFVSRSPFEKSLARHKKREVRVRIRNKKAVWAGDIYEIKRRSTPEQKHAVVRKKRKNLAFAELKRLQKKKVDVKSKTLKVGETTSEVVSKKQEYYLIKRKVRLLRIATKLISMKEIVFRQQGEKKVRTRMPKKELLSRERIHTLDFMIAYVFWFVLRADRVMRREPYVQEITHDRHRDALASKEMTQWILLAIIWQMAQVREQGYISTQAPAQIAQPKGLVTPTQYVSSTMPQQGVIFAYAQHILRDMINLYD